MPEADASLGPLNVSMSYDPVAEARAALPHFDSLLHATRRKRKGREARADTRALGGGDDDPAISGSRYVPWDRAVIGRAGWTPRHNPRPALQVGPRHR